MPVTADPNLLCAKALTFDPSHPTSAPALPFDKVPSLSSSDDQDFIWDEEQNITTDLLGPGGGGRRSWWNLIDLLLKTKACRKNKHVKSYQNVDFTVYSLIMSR